MLVWLNGEFVPEERALVSVFDRGFLYGDGLFETLRICHGIPFRWHQHLDRLQRGARLLGIPFAPGAGPLETAAHELARRNAQRDGVLRITLSRGVGPRGYSPRGTTESPTLAMSLHPAPVAHPAFPPPIRMITSAMTLRADDPLSGYKTANKLPQILARADADRAGADEALLRNTNNDVVEATAANVFWIEGELVCTPLVASGALPGVTRTVVLELCGQLRIKSSERRIGIEALLGADGIFLTNSVRGVVEVLSLDGAPVGRSPLVPRLQQAYTELVTAETLAGANR